MAIKNAIIFIIFFNLLIFVRLVNYISVHVDEVDDCIMNFKINNDFYEIIPTWINPYNIDKCYKNKKLDGSSIKNTTLLRNHEINFNEKVEFVFGDSDHTEGWMKIDIFYNEYLIQARDRVFWRCRDCGKFSNTNYIIENQEGREYWVTSYSRYFPGWVTEVDKRIFFYEIPGSGSTNQLYYYHFDFIINDITELYNGGYDQRAFKVNHNFYSLGPENKN